VRFQGTRSLVGSVQRVSVVHSNITIKYPEKIRVFRVVIRRLCQYHEEESRSFYRGSVVILGLVVVLYRRLHAHQHQEPVHLAKHVLRSPDLQHYPLYLNQ
jgi:hypothetical protein